MQDLTTYNKSAVAIAKKYFNISDIDDFYKKNGAMSRDMMKATK